ncbi:hypothetical protein EW146_g293 [Bondarzewia mesenterica]|uniref:Lethal giant larvae (Lgl)-like C-terminal domain-containing protein n=1 Tax=Bondarzewia mesenterica TaxID=1095465 RepID=A0A4S4M7D9_9AGAM|nr:hypothetical protein EW146_g293 [Bondarzewia mesenterica]
MFSLKSLGRTGLRDFSIELRDRQDWNPGTLKALEYHLDVSAFAVDPVSSLIAIGTLGGIIQIFGAPGVEARLTLPQLGPIKFLEFATNIYKLVCIDEDDRLFLWDLTSIGQIKLEVLTRFNSHINCVTLSPSHTHAYIALESGEIKTYDLLCRRKSSYSIPNAWDLYEKKMRASGMVIDHSPTSHIPIDVVIHPRDLNLVFVAYGGGIVLTNLKECNTLRAYELVLPPGAPGGGGYTSPDILTHRRPSVTSLATHPAGHFFVVGYDDGSIAFWAVEDEGQPLLVRTLDDIDVNAVDGHKLDNVQPADQGSQRDPAPHIPREPIFKLAWSGYPNSSDPRGGETSLIVLGGQFDGDPLGINVLWLPAFNPPEAPVTTTAIIGLHPFYRNAMRQSLDPLNAYFYSTPGITQDFLLIPRSSPHFAGTWDPVAILLLSEGEKQTRSIEAYEYPPPQFLVPPQALSEDSLKEVAYPEDAQDSLSMSLASTLQSMQVTDEPHKLVLPTALWNGPSGIIYASLLTVDRIAYEQLNERASGGPHHEFKLDGGVAVPEESVLHEIKLAKYETHRILMTRHNDLSIRFLDVSVQLQIPSTSAPLTTAFPNYLPALTIDVLALLAFPAVASRVAPGLVNRARVQDVQFTNESLEIAAILSSGDVIVYRLRDGPQDDVTHRQLQDKQLVLLEHVSVEEDLRYKPFFMVTSTVPSTACAISDIGFLAVAYADGSLSVVDMRGPNIIIHVPNEQERKSKRHSLLHRAYEADAVTCLTWTICNISSDPIPRARLLAIQASGLTKAYTIIRSQSGTWAVSTTQVPETETVANPLPGGTFVLDGRTGAPCKADRNRLAIALDRQAGNMVIGSSRKDSEEESGPQCFLIVASAKGVRCFADLGDGRLARAEYGSKAGAANAVQVVERNGSYAFVAFTERHEALVYSLPNLDFLHSLPLPTISTLPPSPDATGDFLKLTPLASYTSPIRRIHLHTLFNVRRGYHTPLVSLTERADGTSKTVPAQPQPVSIGPAGLLSVAGSWLGGLVGQGSMSGDQIDTLLAGPDRPIPEKPAPRGTTQGSGYKYAEWESNPAGASAAEASRTQSTLYERLHAAVAERGEMLGNLEESFNSLEQGSKSMVAQAKRLATQQTAKSWFTFQ